MPKGIYPRKYIDGKFVDNRKIGKRKWNRGNPPRTEEELDAQRIMIMAKIDERQKLLWNQKKRFTKKKIVPCECGLNHAVKIVPMTPTEIIAEIRRLTVIEYCITVSMIDIFDHPIRKNWLHRFLRQIILYRGKIKLGKIIP